MTLPASIRINAQFPFPSLVTGSGPIAISKQNGIWTVGLGFSNLAQFQTIVDPANSYTLVWNAVTNAFTLVILSAVANSKATRILTAAGPYTAIPTDEILIIKQTVGAPFTVNVDWSLRVKPLRVVDGKGDATTNNITITPHAGQTQLASLNYSYIIDGNGGSITLTPLPDGSGAY